MADENNKIITTVIVDVDQAQAELIKLNATATNTTKSLEERLAAKNKAVEIQNELFKVTNQGLQDNIKALEGVAGKEVEYQKAVEKASAEQLKQVKVQQTAQSQIDKLTVANDRQSSAYGKLTLDRLAAQKALKELIAAEGLGTESVTKAAATFNELDKRMKEADRTSGDFTKNVGNYPEPTKEWAASLGALGGQFGDNAKKIIGFVQGGQKNVENLLAQNQKTVEYTKNLIGFGRAQEVATVAQTEMTAAEAANIPVAEESAAATVAAGAGAEVAGAGFTIAAAGTWLFNAALAVLLSPITLVVAAAALLYSIFKDYAPIINPLKDAFASLSVVFVAIKGAIFDLLTGARSFKDILGSITGDIAAAAKETYELAAATRSLGKAQDIQAVATAQNATQIQRFLLQSKDLTRSTKERADLLNKAIDLEKEDFEITKKNSDEAIRIAGLKIFEGRKQSAEEAKALKDRDFAYIRSIKGKRNLDAEAVKAYSDLLIERENLEQKDNGIQEKAVNRRNKIIEKGIADAVAAAKAAADAKKKRDEDAAKARAEREKAAKEALERRKKDAAALISIDETALAEKKTKDPKADTLSDEKAILEKKKALELMSADLLENEKLAIKRKYAELEFELETKDKAAKAAIKKEADEKEFQAQVSLDELKIQQDKSVKDRTLAQSHALLDEEIALMEKKRLHELDNADLTESQKAVINETYRQSELALKKAAAEEEAAVREKTNEDAMNGLAEVFGLQKEVALAQMIMKAPEAIGSSFANAAKVYSPPASLIMGALGAAGVIVPIIKGLNDIKKVRFPGKSSKGAASSGGSISSSVGSISVGSAAANNAAQLGVDPQILGRATATASSNVNGNSKSEVVFHEGKYGDFQNQINFKEGKTKI